MNKYLSFFIGCFFFTLMGNAQYTSIINSNTPGHTQTTYAVGTNVYQFENTFTFNNFKENNVKSEFTSNNFNFRYGVWKEKLEVSLIHKYTTDLSNKSAISGTEVLALGAKYLVYNPQITDKERSELKRSWKKTHGFRLKNLIPSVAVSAHYNTPLTSNNVTTSGSSFSIAAIAQNQLTSKIRVNNQFEYNFLGNDFAEFIYSISGSHVLYKRFNPYFEFRYHNVSKKNNSHYLGYLDFGIGTPFLVNRDLSVAVQYNQIIGLDFSGSSFGINAAYRIDKHLDRWIIKKQKRKDKELEEEEFTEDFEEKKIKRRKKKEQEAEYLDSILDPKERAKAKKRALKEERKALKEEEKEERRRLKRKAKAAEKESIENIDAEGSDTKLDKKAEKKRLKAEKKAAKEEAKRLKKEEKEREEENAIIKDILSY